MESIYINLVVEDELSEAVLRKMLLRSGWPYIVQNCFSNRGFGYIKRTIKGFNNGAKSIPYIVLTDLDNNDCPMSLINAWLPVPRHPNLIFRVAVREVEAWLIADRNNLAKFFGIQLDLLPHQPEEITDPKAELIRLAGYSPHSRLREDVMPAFGSTSQQGPDYNGTMATFVRDKWDPGDASAHSPSLRGALKALAAIAQLPSK